jgi:DNA-binding NarL/FixJ family response regulator
MYILIVDDHPLYIKGVESLLVELDPTIQAQGARSVEDALAIAALRPFDLVLLDLKLPGMNDLDALARVKAALPAIPIVVVSGNENSNDIWRAIELGAAGYIPKNTDPLLVTHALRLVLARGVYIPPQALKDDIAPPTSAHNTDPRRSAALLSERQLDVLQALLQGKSNKVIARDLGIAEGTAKAHLWSIYQALGVNSRLQAMTKAHQLGLVESFKRPG